MSWDGIGDFLSQNWWTGLDVLVAIVIAVIGWFLLKMRNKSSSTSRKQSIDIRGDGNKTSQINVEGERHKVEIHYHFTKEDHDKKLRERLSELRKDLERAHKAEQKLSQREIEILEKEKAAIEEKLLSLEESYKSRVQELEKTRKQLEELRAELPESVLPQAEYQEAVDEIAKGNTELADKLLALVIAKADLVREKAASIEASAYYQRGHIAYNNINWSVAYEYFTQAAKLQPQNWQYQSWAGGLAQDIGEYEAAESHITKALKLAEASEGANHPNTATTLDNLAGLYESQGLYDKAEPLYERALAIREKALAKEHPNVATTLNNLALLYVDQDLYAEAEPLMARLSL